MASSRSYAAKYAANAIDNARPLGVKAMSAIFNGMMKPTPNQDFRRLTKADRLYLRRYYQKAVAEVRLLANFRDELLSSTVSDQDKEKRLDAFMRIPNKALVSLRKLKPQDRLKQLNALVEEYGTVTGNGCGHNKDRFTQFGHVSPYDTRSKKDTYGKGKRRPEMIYRLIDQFIFMALIPDFNKSLFFKRTARFVTVNNANLRRIRSEGRESMVKTMIVLLLNWDPRSMRMGIPTDYDKKEFMGLSVAELAKRAKLSMSRVKTGLRLLEEQDFIHKSYDEFEAKCEKTGEFVKKRSSKQRREQNDDGGWDTFPVVRVLKPKLFNSMSLDKRATTERSKPTFMTPAAERAEALPGVDVSNVRSAADLMSAMVW